MQLVEEFQASRAGISWLITSETSKAVNHLDQQKEQAAAGRRRRRVSPQQRSARLFPRAGTPQDGAGRRGVPQPSSAARRALRQDPRRLRLSVIKA